MTTDGLEIERLLDRTHAALIAGDLAALAPLAVAVEDLAGTIGRVDSATARRLHAKADRNGRMLQAAARGVRAARSRIAEISAEPGLTTYDARGRRDCVGRVSAELPKRF